MGAGGGEEEYDKWLVGFWGRIPAQDHQACANTPFGITLEWNSVTEKTLRTALVKPKLTLLSMAVLPRMCT